MKALHVELKACLDLTISVAGFQAILFVSDTYSYEPLVWFMNFTDALDTLIQQSMF